MNLISMLIGLGTDPKEGKNYMPDQSCMTMDTSPIKREKRTEETSSCNVETLTMERFSLTCCYSITVHGNNLSFIFLLGSLFLSLLRGSYGPKGLYL